MSFDTLINEPVKVWCFFDNSPRPGHMSPIAILWRRRLVKFQKLVFASSKKIGEVKILNLVCCSDGANYELEYNSLEQTWRLKKVMPCD